MRQQDILRGKHESEDVTVWVTGQEAKSVEGLGGAGARVWAGVQSPLRICYLVTPNTPAARVGLLRVGGHNPRNAEVLGLHSGSGQKVPVHLTAGGSRHPRGPSTTGPFHLPQLLHQLFLFAAFRGGVNCPPSVLREI